MGCEKWSALRKYPFPSAEDVLLGAYLRFPEIPGNTGRRTRLQATPSWLVSATGNFRNIQQEFRAAWEKAEMIRKVEATLPRFGPEFG